MGAALITAIPMIVSAAPQIAGLIGGLVNLIHRHEAKPAATVVAATSADGSSVTVTPVAAPVASGADKKAGVLYDFETIALPFIAPALSLALKRPIDANELMPEISEMVDLIVRINHTLGVFQKAV